MKNKPEPTVDDIQKSELTYNDLINNLAHEFKTPLASIAGFAKVLKSCQLQSDISCEYLDIIISEAERLLRLSDNFLQLSRLQNISAVSNKETFNLSEQIRLVIILLENKWSAKCISIQLHCDELEITANKDLLQQIWINLIDNAIKFSPQNKEIHISLESDKEDIRVLISDQGCGMSEETVKYAFERFYQADTDQKSKGNGIGLALVKRICLLHSGSITIKSSDYNGTTFEVVLPIK